MYESSVWYEEMFPTSESAWKFIQELACDYKSVEYYAPEYRVVGDRK